MNRFLDYLALAVLIVAFLAAVYQAVWLYTRWPRVAAWIMEKRQQADREANLKHRLVEAERRLAELEVKVMQRPPEE